MLNHKSTEISLWLESTKTGDHASPYADTVAVHEETTETKFVSSNVDHLIGTSIIKFCSVFFFFFFHSMSITSNRSTENHLSAVCFVSFYFILFFSIWVFPSADHHLWNSRFKFAYTVRKCIITGICVSVSVCVWMLVCCNRSCFFGAEEHAIIYF